MTGLEMSRELANVVERILVMHSHEREIRALHLAGIVTPAVTRRGQQTALHELEGLRLEEAVARVERHLIIPCLGADRLCAVARRRNAGNHAPHLEVQMDLLGIQLSSS